jgi:predicted metal-dependent peptidase
VARNLDALKVAAARLWACERWPYLASGLLALDVVAAPGLGTFAVDVRWNVYLDPAVVDRWSTAQIGIVLNHELQHLLRHHAGRARAIGVSHDDRGRWNVAADAEINDDLFAEVRHEMKVLRPVMPADIGLAGGRMAEHYFAHLDGTRHGAVEDEGSGVDGLVKPWEVGRKQGVDAREAGLLRRSIALAVVEHVRSAGRVPGGLRRWAEARAGTAVDWKLELASVARAKIATRRGVSDYSYRHLSRRGSTTGVIFPGMTASRIEIAVVVDTSASVRDEELARAASEVIAIARTCAADGGTVHLIPCDAVASRPRRVLPQTARTLHLDGGGGTDMAAGIEASLALRPKPHAVIVITDGETPWPDQAPPVPVILALLDHGWWPDVPEWARTIRIPLDLT